MPTQSYPIGGHVYDGNQEPIVGAVVYITDTTTGERVGTDYYATTNATGEFILNLQNLSTYSDGDGWELTATHSTHLIAKRTGTVVIASGGETSADLYMDDITPITFSTTTVKEINRDVALGGQLARAGKSFIIWANNKAATASAAVVRSGGGGRGRGYTSDGVPVVNIGLGEIAYIKQMTVNVRTNAKTCQFELVKCAGADGAGTTVSLSGMQFVTNGTQTQGRPFTIVFPNTIRVPYNALTSKSLGVKIKGTDTSTYVDFQIQGEVLEE